MRYKKEDEEMYVVKSSKVHGSGIFAKTKIPKGTRIVEYIGEIVSKKEGNKRAEKQAKLAKKNGGGSVYVFEIDKKHDLDGNFSYNTARLINHSCEPNCKYRMYRKRIWIVAKRDIMKGEELSYDYGFDIDDYENNLCKCGSKNCIGFIVGKSYLKKFEKLIRKEEDKLNRKFQIRKKKKGKI